MNTCLSQNSFSAQLNMAMMMVMCMASMCMVFVFKNIHWAFRHYK